jgi:hypothetical protein
MTAATVDRRRRCLRRLLAACALCGASAADAADVVIELPVNYALVRAALVEQIFIGPDATARVLEGKNACNILTLSEPDVDGVAGRIRVRTRVTSRGGTPLTKGRCLPLFEWNGMLEATEEPRVLDGQRAIGFRVTDSKILNDEGGSSAVPGVLWRWVKENVHPRLEQLRIDLDVPLAAAGSLLREQGTADAAALEEVLASARFTSASASVEALNIAVALRALAPPPGWAPPAAEPALSVEELAQWREAWQAWDVFATWLIKELAIATTPMLRDALASVLLDARHDLVAALESDSGKDPVRDLFRKSWQRLRPVMRELGASLPAGDALRLLSFMTAADVLDQLDRAAPQLGFRIDRDTLRRLARTLRPGLTDDMPVYSTDVDPALRALFGFDPELATDSAAQPGALDFLIAPAYAMVDVDPTLGQKLQGWVPRGDDLDAFLRQVALLLDAIAEREVERGKIEPAYVDIYRALLPATAWQETCWRQFEIRNDRIDTVQSPVGSIGIMQVNKYVWRGIYNLDALLGDVSYNARAGNEILVHYLVDYAIRRGEHRKRGNPDDLARAAYAVYNGGPAQLARYRKADARPSERKIDESFYNKFKQVRRHGPEAVKACYGG